MDAGAVANILRRPAGPSGDGGPDRVALNLRLAIAVVAAQGGRADLQRELQSLAGRFPMIRLVQSPGGVARLEAGPLRAEIPATLRDALLAAARGAAPKLAASGAAAAPEGAAARAAVTATGSGAPPAAPSAAAAGAVSAPATGPSPVVAAGAAGAAPTAAAAPAGGLTANAVPAPNTAAMPAAAETAAGAFSLLAAAARRAVTAWPTALLAQVATRPRAAAEPLPARLDLPLAQPLLDEAADTSAAAARLQAAVRGSGVFLEAQLARSILRQQDGDGALPPREPGGGGQAPPPAERIAAQLEVLRKDSAAFVLAAWNGQTLGLDLGREPVDPDRGQAAVAGGERIFAATLRLDLHRYGPLTVKLRLANSTLAVTVEAAAPEPWRAALPELAARLQARGLQPAGLQAVARQGQDDAQPA
jgi:flagellar hook-length control protein FliK